MSGRYGVWAEVATRRYAKQETQIYGKKPGS
mgnify:CR=1 FL=1